MTKFEETIELLKRIDDVFASKYDEIIQLIKKSRTPEGKDIQVEIEGISPMPEDEEGSPYSDKILSKVTITQGKTVTVLTVRNITRNELYGEDRLFDIANIETTTKRLIGKKITGYTSRVHHIDDYYLYYGESRDIALEREKEFPIDYYDLSKIAEIGRYHVV